MDIKMGLADDPVNKQVVTFRGTLIAAIELFEEIKRSVDADDVWLLPFDEESIELRVRRGDRWFTHVFSEKELRSLKTDLKEYYINRAKYELGG